MTIHGNIWDHIVSYALILVTGLLLYEGFFVYAAMAGGITCFWIIKRILMEHPLKRNLHLLEIERMESWLEAQKEASQDVKRMADIGQLASGIAHDIAGPLSVVIGTVKMLMEDDAAKIFQKDLERIARAAQLCETIASNILSVARTHEIEPEPCDLRRVAESALQIYEPQLSTKKIRIVKEFSQELSYVNGNAAQLERVFLNLFSNAKSAMPGGGELKITINQKNPRTFSSPWVEVIIEDEGPGISPEAFAKIFKPFNTTKAPGEGTGLGLYVSRQIAMNHRGRLHVENRDDGGARFILSLPSASDEMISEAFFDKAA